MAQLPTHCADVSNVEPRKSMEAFPAGEYTLHFVESEMKLNSKGTGEYLQLVAEVIDGEHKGRKIWERLNLNNPSQVAVEIAYATFSAICKACNKVGAVDSTELHNIPFRAKVKYVPAQGTFKARNEIDEYLAASAATAMPAQPQPAAAPVAANGANSTPPWQRTAA